MIKNIIITLLLAASSYVVSSEPPPTPKTAYRAIVVRVKDGDTCVVNIELGFDLWKHNEVVRLLNIFAPETFRPKSAKERTDGEKVKKFLIERLTPGEEIVIVTDKDKRDMYGRAIGVLWDSDGNVNDALTEYMKASKIKQNN
jgi:endonuclease YncB( thermonuclease family)